MDSLFTGLFSSTGSDTMFNFLLCIFASLIIGILFMVASSKDAKNTKSFLFCVALLPAVVCVVIMMVNGNVGAGVAVAGAFSLVRFRSNPGTAKEVIVIFMAMCAGLVTGMGYLFYAAIYSIIMCAILFIYNSMNLDGKSSIYKTLRITIPEDLDYSEVFSDILSSYTKHYELTSVRTTNLGSLYKLTYNITLKEANCEKKMIDELRTRNGNLEISISRQDNSTTEM